MSKERTGGLFISFEGLEASGKSTQITLLADALRQAGGREILTLREPGGTAAGERIRNLLQHEDEGSDLCPEAETLLFCASRAQLVRQCIVPALERGAVVISDRFADSTTAYQGAARRLSGEVVAALNRFATGGLLPHITFLMDLPAEAALARLAGRGEAVDRMEREALPFHRAVREAYLEIARREPERVVVLDALEKPQAVQSRIRENLKERYGLFA